MAALLVAMGIMAIMMTVAMPVWKQAAQREKEAELVFRGMQYVHAISLFQRKYANAFPPNIDVLVEQRFLRKKFKDPITNEDFQPLLAGQAAPGITAPPGGGAATPGGAAGRSGAFGRSGAPLSATQPVTGPGGRGTSPIGTPGAGGVGGVMGVTSKSKDKSIRLFNGRNRYNEWAFVFTPQQAAPGAGVPGAATPGVVPGQRGQPGQRGPFPPGRGSDGRGIGGGRPGFPGTQDPFRTQPIFPPGRGRSGG